MTGPSPVTEKRPMVAAEASTIIVPMSTTAAITITVPFTRSRQETLILTLKLASGDLWKARSWGRASVCWSWLPLACESRVWECPPNSACSTAHGEPEIKHGGGLSVIFPS